MDKELIPNLFRTEFAKLVAVICKTYGMANIQLAEDVVSDTFLKATETWGLKGVPKNPKAWLYTVAKNNIKDYFRKANLYTHKIEPELKANIQNNYSLNLSENNIKDSQLEMMFAICDPIISKNAQVTLALRLLCGFGIEEIANGLLTTKSTINKRLIRSKKTFKAKNIKLELPSKNEQNKRLNNVLTILYLLFNEGYYSSSTNFAIKKELCIESMRLLYMLLNDSQFNNATTNGLMALFCFQSSRFDARLNINGEILLYHQQNENKWDKDLILKGEHYLNIALNLKEINKYVLEAYIAFWHSRINVDKNQKWQNILQLYNQLIQIEYSPITALNRTYALSKVYGNEKAINEALKINLSKNHFYHTLLANLYAPNNKKKQILHLKTALTLTKSINNKKIIKQLLKNAKA